MLTETSKLPTRLLGFLIEVQVAENGPDPQTIADKFADALGFVEHVGRVQVDYLGMKSEDGKETLELTDPNTSIIAKRNMPVDVDLSQIHQIGGQ